MRENTVMPSTTTPFVSPAALELAQALVRIDTQSHHSNLELIDLVRERLKRLGIDSRLTFNDERTKANLFPPIGEGKSPGVIRSGHTDTVPWEGQDWKFDPLGGEIDS